MMYPTAPMALDAWADVDAAIAAARQSRQNKIERLSTLSSLVILVGAIWLMWPNLQSAFKGDSGLFQGLGYPLLIIATGSFYKTACSTTHRLVRVLVRLPA